MPHLSLRNVVLVLVVLLMLAAYGVFRVTHQERDVSSLGKSNDPRSQGSSSSAIQRTTNPTSPGSDTRGDLHNPSEPPARQSPSLKTIEERQRYYDGLLQDDPETVWQEWKQLLNGGDGLQREYVKNALALHLQRGGHEEIYLEAENLLTQVSLPSERKSFLVDLLTETATPIAIEVLINALKDESNTSSRAALITGIEKMGDYRWGSRFHPELSAPLEKAWVEFTDDPLVSASLARGIAKAGAPNGIAMLLETIANSGATLADVSTNPQGSAALSAMDAISNPAAIPVLAKTLSQHKLDDPAFIASGEGLVAMGSPEATNVLLSWAKQAPDDSAPLVEKWFSNIRDDKSLDLLRGASSSVYGMFRSAKVKESVASIVRRFDSRYVDE